MNVIKNIAELTPATGLILFVLLISVNSILLKKRGVQVRAAGSNKSVNVKWFYPVFAVFFLLFLAEITRPLHSFSVLPEVLTNFIFDSVLIRLTGVLAIFFSVLILRTTLQHFGTSLRFGLNENNAGKLVKIGVFSRSRNPFFLSLLLFFIGTFLVFPNVFFLIFVVSAIVGIHFSILKEERFLYKVYNEEYKKYMANVRRYI